MNIKKILKWSGIGFVCLMSLIIILAINTGSSKPTANKATSPTATPNTQAVIAVSAYQLAGDYHANEVSADNKYKNNLLEISGTIDSIGKDILGYPFITLSNGSDSISLNDVECSFDQTDSNNSALSSLSKGQKITLEGTGSGMTLTQVMVKNCSVVP